MTFPIPPASRYKWSEKAGRYKDKKTGRFVSPSVVKRALESVIKAANKDMQRLSTQLNNKQITIRDWQDGMKNLIKISHTAAACAARGGWAQMSRSDWGAVGNLIKIQNRYLRDFAKDVRRKKQPLGKGLSRRAKMYADAARATFEATRRRYEELMNGKTKERRILGAADHCKDCVAEARKGWKPIGTLRPIGDSICLTNCHCKFEYK